MDVSPKLRGGLRAFAHTQGPLDPVEWSFMRRHPLVGERILLEVPALRPVARLVRSSHEPIGEDEALLELRRCAWAQFDPMVVKAFCKVIARERPDRDELSTRL